MDRQAVSAELLAVIVAMVDDQPCVLTLGAVPRLPAGPLMPGHRSLQAATRAWVEEQTGRRLGYLEQLYTFVDLDVAQATPRSLSVSYLGLTTPTADTGIGGWRAWYDLMPWEDTRPGTGLLEARITPSILAWAESDPVQAAERRQRCAITFGLAGQPWQTDLALQRYELLWEAGLVPESPDERRRAAGAPGRPAEWWQDPGVPGVRMDGDHRRVLATGIARLRTKIQYRPVVFELMPEEFTLGQLQACVEALAGQEVHTQNFRRVVEQQQLVEETGGRAATGGRPARLYRFRQEVLQEHRAAGTKLPRSR